MIMLRVLLDERLQRCNSVAIGRTA
jgi:hypothetical protein